MRIFEIFNTQSNITEKKLDIKIQDREKSMMPSKYLEYLDSGVNSMVYTMKKYPNAVIKMTPVHGKDAMAVQFLRVCTNNQTNPFFPKIYAYKLMKSKQLSEEEKDLLYSKYKTGVDFEIFGDLPYVLIMVVEKLKPLNSVSLTQQVKLFKDIGVDVEIIRDKFIDMYDIFDEPKDRLDIIKNTPNKDFAKALRLLEPLFNNYQQDMHDGNFMLRGSQLVIIDPVI